MNPSLSNDTQNCVNGQGQARRLDKRFQTQRLGEKLRSLRQELGLSQAQVGYLLGVDAAAIRNYELGRATPTRDHLGKLADIYGVTPESLTIFDFSDRKIFANDLFQLQDIYGLWPFGDNGEKDGSFGGFIVSPCSSLIKQAVHDWSARYSDWREGRISESDYRKWQDTYAAEINPVEAPGRYTMVNGEWVLIEPWQNIQFAKTLRQLREEQGLSQAKMADRIGISAGVYRSYESARRLPTTSRLPIIGKRLGISYGVLVFTDFGTPLGALHALFQIADEFGMTTQIEKCKTDSDYLAYLKADEKALTQFLNEWAKVQYENRENRIAYQSWKRTCEFPKTDVDSAGETAEQTEIDVLKEIIAEKDAEIGRLKSKLQSTRKQLDKICKGIMEVESN